MSNVGASVSNERMVLHLVSGLSDANATVTLKSVILKFCLLSTRFGLWLSWKKRRWPNAHRTTLTTLCLLLLKRTILSTLLLLAPIETNKTPPAVAADAVAQAIIVVEELTVVAEADDHNIIKMGHGISRRHIVLGFPSGSHEPFLLALILPLEIRTNQPLQTVNPAFLGREHSRHTWLQHNHHTHQ